MPNRIVVAAFAFALASNCSGCLGCASPVEQPNSNLPSSCQTTPPAIDAQKLDILFVIDNSGSMAEEQVGVARELTGFIDELKKGGGVPQDFHVGVITTTVYQHSLINGVKFYREYPAQSGRLQPVPDAAPDGGVTLGTGSERILTGDDPDLTSKFSRLVRQGTNGSGQETPFEAARLALVDLADVPIADGGNQGFLRDGSRLLVVVLTDEEDCSETARPSKATIGDNNSIDYCTQQSNLLTPVNDYHGVFTEQLKDSRGIKRDIIWTAIAPVGESNKQAMLIVDNGQVRNIDCPTSNGPGTRQRQMAEMFDPTLTNLDSICRASYRATLLTIASLANISQTLDIRNVPDPHMLQVNLHRADDTVQTCTLANQGLSSYDAPVLDQPGKLHFSPTCKRRSDDREVEVKMLCAN